MKSYKISRDEFIENKLKQIDGFLKEELPEKAYELEFETIYSDLKDLIV